MEAVDIVSDAAPSTYSFIIQSNIFVPLLVTHDHQLPPHLPANSDKSHPLIHAAAFH